MSDHVLYGAVVLALWFAMALGLYALAALLDWLDSK